jgi:hypothetical protein
MRAVVKVAMAHVRELYRAIARENALREQIRAEVRAEEAAKKPPVPTAHIVDPTNAIPAAPAWLPGEESEMNSLVRELWQQSASARQIGDLLGYTERHIRRVLKQMRLRLPDAQISPPLQARCEAFRLQRGRRRSM